MKYLYKLLRQDPESRDGVITATSALSIIVNVIISVIKIVIGLLTSSIAIVTEGINNAADAMSSVLTVVGTKLSKKHPDRKHPFGYGRIEYLTGLIVAGIILFAGLEALKDSFRLVFHPEPLKVTYWSLAIIAVSAIVKFFMSGYIIKMGTKVSSVALVGVGMENREDFVASVVTIIASLIFLISGLSVDAYAGIIVSALIIRAGIEVLVETLHELIGRPGEKELADKIYQEIRSTPGIIAAADMMLHNYGPDRYSGSVNVEMDHSKTVGEIYRILHQLQLKIMHEDKVTMVFGVYAVDNEHEEIRAVRSHISRFVKETEHLINAHAVYIEPESGTIYCDIIVDYELKDWDELRTAFENYMHDLYPDNPIDLTIETEFV